MQSFLLSVDNDDNVWFCMNMYDNIASHDSHGRYSRRRLQRCRRRFATGYSTAARLAASLCRRRRAMGYRFAKKLWESLTGCGISGSEHILKRLVPNHAKWNCTKSYRIKLLMIAITSDGCCTHVPNCSNAPRGSEMELEEAAKLPKQDDLDRTMPVDCILKLQGWACLKLEFVVNDGSEGLGQSFQEEVVTCIIQLLKCLQPKVQFH